MGKVIYMSKLCQAEGCGKLAAIRGHCRAHYQKLRKTGALAMSTAERQARGRKEDHPLYFRWAKLHGQLAPEWAHFWNFVDGVGDPNGCTKLMRPDRSKPLGPENFRWAEKLIGERKNAYYRAWYKKNPAQRDRLYQKTYGIGVAEYDALLAKQGGACAICRKEESRPVRPGVNDDIRRLAVDHDHETGAVRGLLCGKCNTRLGNFGDDAGILFAAVQYVTQSRGVRKIS